MSRSEGWPGSRIDPDSPRRNLASSFAFVPLHRACLRSCQPQSSLMFCIRVPGSSPRPSLQIPSSPNISNWPSQVSNKGTKVSSPSFHVHECKDIKTWRLIGRLVIEGFCGKMLLSRVVIVKNNWLAFRHYVYTETHASPPRSAPVCAGFGLQEYIGVVSALGSVPSIRGDLLQIFRPNIPISLVMRPRTT